MPATAIVSQMINALVAAGGADLDYAAIGTVLFALSGDRASRRIHPGAAKVTT